MAASTKEGFTEGNKFYQLPEHLFLVQHNDGYFSYRIGIEPSQFDAAGQKINHPENANLFHVIPQEQAQYTDYDTDVQTPYCYDFRFICFFYAKTCANRLNLPLESFNALDQIEAKKDINPEKYRHFRDRFFLYPPLAEFFSDARNNIREFHTEIVEDANLITSNKSQHNAMDVDITDTEMAASDFGRRSYEAARRNTFRK